MTDYYHTKEAATAYLQGAGLTFAGFLDWMYRRWTMENVGGGEARYSATQLREYINETMTKQELDAKNIANLNAYMDDLGMPKEDRDALPFGGDKLKDYLTANAMTMEGWEEFKDEMRRRNTDLLSYAKGYEDAQKAAKEVAEVGGWISVEDRLPDEDQKCLTFAKEFGIEVTTHGENGYFTYPFNQVFKATHWQPLPAPPKTT